MSFAAETEKLVNEIIQAEYNNACKQFGEEMKNFTRSELSKQKMKEFEVEE